MDTGGKATISEANKEVRELDGVTDSLTDSQIKTVLRTAGEQGGYLPRALQRSAESALICSVHCVVKYAALADSGKIATLKN
ncbi:hypothetical protein RUM44_003603 [Polyplax serrata]|uniref:Uncharacterized protein n=1 Tax=Polyplax serrata TaxID=468196 RepID=A0ABR1AGX9_POLSC